MRLALLANSRSGRGRAPDAERLLREQGAEVRRFPIDDPGQALAWRPERIAVAGGDGSIARAAEAAGSAGVPLAVIPAGTANDFARALRLPLDLHEACRLAATGHELRQLELARVDGRPFVNAASTGLAPAAARRAHGLKRLLGPVAYSVAAVRVALTARPIACRVRCDGGQLFDGQAWQVTVAATGAFGGGSSVDGDPHDGWLDVVVIEAGSRIRLAHHGYGLRAGRLESQRRVRSARAREVEVDTDAGDFNVDGEVVHVAQPRFHVEGRAFKLVSA